ncbi:hypothetical protein [Sphingobium sp. EP60837]|uniref:hypothetical protein n=1 Tax=Sphingobium sp. EP60837 TaxID=1855519 RepID=UPI0008359B0D
MDGADLDRERCCARCSIDDSALLAEDLIASVTSTGVSFRHKGRAANDRSRQHTQNPSIFIDNGEIVGFPHVE